MHAKGGFAVFAVCGFECVALASRGRVPTVTALVHRYRHRPLMEAAVWGLLALGWHHFLRSVR